MGLQVDAAIIGKGGIEGWAWQQAQHRQ